MGNELMVVKYQRMVRPKGTFKIKHMTLSVPRQALIQLFEISIILSLCTLIVA